MVEYSICWQVPAINKQNYPNKENKYKKTKAAWMTWMNDKKSIKSLNVIGRNIVAQFVGYWISLSFSRSSCKLQTIGKHFSLRCWKCPWPCLEDTKISNCKIIRLGTKEKGYSDNWNDFCCWTLICPLRSFWPGCVPADANS